MKLGIIGGSGLYDLPGLRTKGEEMPETPFGPPSDVFVHGELEGVEVYFLPRHGRGHRIMPSEINHRANIFGMKVLGVDRIVSVSAVGSLKEDLHPRDIVLVDQYFDRTRRPAEHTFFGNGIVGHIPFSDPSCPELRALLAGAARRAVARTASASDVQIHEWGTYVNMEGPAFSTRAESEVYRRLGFDVIGMTSLAEAKLSREAEICYQVLAMVTDYDCWHESEDAVTVEMIMEHVQANTALAREVICELAPRLPAGRACECGHALANAVITRPDAIRAERIEVLKPIVGKYLGSS